MTSYQKPHFSFTLVFQTVQTIQTMPRNASATKRKKKASIDAEERYARESLHKRTICYHFWNFIDIDGKKGDLWNPVKTPGSVYNRRSSAYLVNTIPERSFDKIAKVSNC